MRAMPVVLAALAILVAAPVSSQVCGTGGRDVGVVAGPVFYDMGSGLSGLELGATAAFATDRLAVGASASRIDLSDSALDPWAVRAQLSYPVIAYREWDVCVRAHGGLSWFGDDDADASIIAGGAGLVLSRPFSMGAADAAFQLEARGLGASATGAALGLDFSAVGLSLGGASGLSIWLGPVRLEASVAVDGFAGGLGPTPYPGQAYRLAASFGF